MGMRQRGTSGINGTAPVHQAREGRFEAIARCGPLRRLGVCGLALLSYSVGEYGIASVTGMDLTPDPSPDRGRREIAAQGEVPYDGEARATYDPSTMRSTTIAAKIRARYQRE